MSIQIEQQNNITIISLNRPHARNAVDRTTAQALADAFRAFDVDDNAAVGVLCGEHGTFCAGADLAQLQKLAQARTHHGVVIN